jgi:hypothetical protein
MNLDMIQEMWEKDSEINDLELDKESLSIPKLHSKYYRIYNEFLLLKKKTEFDLKVIQKDKWLYYSGKAPSEVYKEKPFDYKVLKNDIGIYIDSDEDVARIKLKIEYQDCVISYLESILKTIGNRTFQIKNAIDWKKFIEGVT